MQASGLVTCFSSLNYSAASLAPKLQPLQSQRSANNKAHTEACHDRNDIHPEAVPIALLEPQVIGNRDRAVGKRSNFGVICTELRRQQALEGPCHEACIRNPAEPTWHELHDWTKAELVDLSFMTLTQ